MGSLTVVEICLKMKTATTSADCKVLERMMKKKQPLMTKIIEVLESMMEKNLY